MVLIPTAWSYTLQWRHNGRDGVSNHQPYDCLLNCSFRRRSKKTSKHRVTGLCGGNSSVPHKGPVTREMFPFDDVIMSDSTFAKTMASGYSHNSWIARISTKQRNHPLMALNTLRPGQHGCHLQTMHSNWFSWLEILVFWFEFQWSLFLKS